jgi:hypothetical protein
LHGVEENFPKGLDDNRRPKNFQLAETSELWQASRTLYLRGELGAAKEVGLQ